MENKSINIIYNTALSIGVFFKNGTLFAMGGIMVSSLLTIFGLPFKELIVPFLLVAVFMVVLMWVCISIAMIIEKKFQIT